MQHAPGWIVLIAFVLTAGQGPSTAAPPREAAWREVVVEPAPGGATDLRLECFLVTASRERLGELERHEEAWGESPGAILEQLRRYGRAQQVALLQERVVLEHEAELSSTSRLPVVVSKDRITLEACGTVFRLSGAWEQQADAWAAAVNTEIEVTVPLLPGSTTAPDGVDPTGPMMISGRLAAEADLSDGKPTVLVGTVTQATAPRGQRREQADGEPVHGLVVARLTLARAAPAGQRQEKPAQTAVRSDGQQIQYSVQVFSVDGESRKLAGLRDEQVEALGDAGADEVLAELRRFGRAELLSRPNLLLEAGQSGTVTIEEKVPLVADTPSREDEPAITYANVGFSIELEGDWLEAIDKDLARIGCRLTTSQLRTVKPDAAPRIVKSSRRYAGHARSGQPTWLPARAAWTVRGEEAMLLLVRLTAWRLRAKDSAPPASAPAIASAQKPAAQPRVQLDLWKVEGDRGRMAGADWETLIGEGPVSGTALELAGGLGRAERLARATGTVDTDEALTATFGDEPDPSSWEEQEDTQKPAGFPTFANVAVEGEWGRNTPATAGLSVGVKVVHLPAPDRPEGSVPPTLRQDQTEQRMELNPGGREWVRSSWSVPADNATAKPEPLILARVKLLGDEAPSSAKPQPATGMNAACLVISVFELDCPAETFLGTDFARLGRQHPTADRFFQALSALGTARLIRQGQLQVNDQQLGCESASGERVPLATAPLPTTAGRRGADIKYVSVGTQAEWCGTWTDAAGGPAVIDMAVRHSGNSQTTVSAIPLPVSADLNMTASAALASAEPCVLVCSRGHQPNPEAITCDIIQVVASRPAVEASEATVDETARALARRRAEQSAHMRVETFVTELSGELSSFSAPALEPAVTAGEVMKRLQQAGATRLLAAFEGEVLLDGDNRLKQSQRVPLMRKEARFPTVSYVVTDLLIGLSGCWREDDPELADARLVLECSDVLSDSGGERTSLAPIQGRFDTQRQTTLVSGRPQFNFATQIIDPTPGEERFRLVTTRWTVTRRTP